MYYHDAKSLKPNPKQVIFSTNHPKTPNLSHSSHSPSCSRPSRSILLRLPIPAHLFYFSFISHSSIIHFNKNPAPSPNINQLDSSLSQPPPNPNPRPSSPCLRNPKSFQFHAQYCFYNQQASAILMQTLQQENAKIALAIEQFLQEIERQKELNVQHQNQIETLLHFNQRLLLIIEKQMNNRRDTCSLQPISERSERSSDLLGTCTLQSLIRSKKLAVKSEWGGATRESLIERKRFKDARISIFDQVSEAESLRNQKSEPQTEPFKAPSQNILFRSEVRKGLEELKQFKDKTNTFYTQKMSELKSLSSKITAYHPLNELSKIGEKACVSDQTMTLIRRRVFKSP